MARQPVVGQGLLINEASRSHSDTPQSLSPIFSMARHPLVGLRLGLLTVEVSRSDTPHSGGLLWTSDRPFEETSLPDNTQHSQETSMPRWDSNPQSQQASGRRPMSLIVHA